MDAPEGIRYLWRNYENEWYGLCPDGRLFIADPSTNTVSVQIYPYRTHGCYPYWLLTQTHSLQLLSYPCHTLMGEVFLSKPSTEGNWIIHHRDHDITNYHISNLEWLSQSENIKEAYHADPRETAFWHSVCKAIASGEKNVDIARRFKISQATVSQVRKRKRHEYISRFYIFPGEEAV